MQADEKESIMLHFVFVGREWREVRCGQFIEREDRAIELEQESEDGGWDQMLFVVRGEG